MSSHRRKQHRLTITGQKTENGTHFILKSLLQNTIGLVDTQSHEILDREIGGALQMVQQTTRRAHEQIDSIAQSLCLALFVGPSNNDTKGVVKAVVHQIASHTVNLHGQLARGRNDNHARTVALLEMRAVQQLDARNEKGKGLSRSRFALAEHILSGQQRRDGLLLNLGHLFKFEFLANALFEGIGNGKIVESLRSQHGFIAHGIVGLFGRQAFLLTLLLFRLLHCRRRLTVRRSEKEEKKEEEK